MIRVALVMGQYPAEEKRRREQAIRAFCNDSIDVGVIEATAIPYTQGFGSRSVASAIPAYLDSFREAEAAGYDAVVPLGILDIAIVEGRQAVSIPVLGALESALFVAATKGRRAGLIVYSDNLIGPVAALVGVYGAGSNVAGYTSVGAELTELASREGELEDRFCSAAEELIEDSGADVIVSAGISLCPVHLDRRQLERRLRVPVVDAISSPIYLAAALTQLKRLGIDDAGLARATGA